MNDVGGLQESRHGNFTEQSPDEVGILQFLRCALQGGIDPSDLQIPIMLLLISEAEHLNGVRTFFQAGKIPHQVIHVNPSPAVSELPHAPSLRARRISGPDVEAAPGTTPEATPSALAAGLGTGSRA